MPRSRAHEIFLMLRYYDFSAEKFQVITDRVNQSKALDVSDCFTGLCFEDSINCHVSSLLSLSEDILKSDKKKEKNLRKVRCLEASNLTFS